MKVYRKSKGKFITLFSLMLYGQTKLCANRVYSENVDKVALRTFPCRFNKLSNPSVLVKNTYPRYIILVSFDNGK